jgi:hypothetical protein
MASHKDTPKDDEDFVDPELAEMRRTAEREVLEQ